MRTEAEPGQPASNVAPKTDPTVDLVIVGAGFAGLYMLQRARSLGLRARVFEAGAGVGGTWYWNRYPGARCDVESMEYSYQFSDDLQQQWQWSERFAPQPEILRYANHVADRFDLRRDISFETRVLSAHFDASSARWRVMIDRGGAVSSQFVVMATGCLSSTNLPKFKGLGSFAGERYHTGTWPHEPVDFSGKRVAVIGTGSSAIQSIPVIAQQATELTVFQRTANFSIPARNAPLDPAHEAAVKAEYPAFRARNSLMMAAFGGSTPRNEAPALAASPEERKRRFDERWTRGGLGFTGAFNDLMINQQANDLAAEYVRERIRAVVDDPATAELLSPRQVIGCKRICADSGYYETFNQPHVKLVDISAGGIEEITPRGVKAGGREFEVDCIVFATGFDAMTGSLLKIDIRGRDGVALSEAWRAGPRTYLGLNVAGFPNLFTVSGPGSPSVLTNMIVSIEQHVNWITDCIVWMRAGGQRTIEAEPQAQDAWVGHVNAVAGATLFPTCNSWYLGANVPGKTRVFMPLLGFPAYVQRCDEVVARGYEGFRVSA
jgi:cyclohexanone monooxygenase